MKRVFIFLYLFSAGMAFGQVSAINLEDCYRLARENYPKLSDTQRQKEISDLRMQNIGIAWKPQLNFGGQGTYQSEVTKVNVSIPGVNIASPSNDQYKAYLDVRQTCLLYTSDAADE